MNLLYVFQHGDAVLIATFLVLILMSLSSWYVIFWKAWKLHQERERITHYKQNPTAKPKDMEGSVRLLLEKAEYRSDRDMHLSQTLDIIRTWLDKGLTVLASIGSSAPFIGLFGTVWGIYGALTRIAAEGNASLNVVAGPMGEALVATAVGLFAAIPAVLAYNAFVRANRLLMQDLRHIAEQLSARG